MIIPSDETKFLYNWRYLEIARFMPELGRVIRIKNGNDPVMIDINELSSFRDKYNNTGLYTSVWHFNSKKIDKAVRFGSLYFDIDNDDPSVSLTDCIKLYEYLIQFIPKESVLVYFTGKKGFHIECEAQCLGINPSNNLPNIFRWIANYLKDKLSLNGIDFSVYDGRRMWRLAGSMHQDTKLFKNLIPYDLLVSDISSIVDFCKQPANNDVTTPAFSATANEWYRNHIYESEIDKERSKDFISYFNKHGSVAFKDLNESEKEFTPKRLLQGCPAIRRLWQQAIDTHWLEHEARLFLCSILSYTEESIKFLHEILSNCDDYNYEKSNSHINDWIKRRQLGIGGRPFTCERANASGVGCGQCSLDKRKKWIKIGDKYVESDEVSSPSPVRFAYVAKGRENNE